MKVALVQDWLTVIGGSEYVFKEIASLYPEADIYTLVKRDETVRDLGLAGHNVYTSFIQNLPFSKTKYRNYLPFFPLAIEQFDLSSYDLIISSSHAVAKGVLTNAGQIHICYCHSPMRYAWDLYHQYIKEANLQRGLKAFIVKCVLHYIRQWDISSSGRVDYFISNSNYIGKRIKKIYNRDSFTIYPNVATESYNICIQKDDFYLTCSRFVPYKKIDLIVNAFKELPDKKLVVIGDGPDYEKTKKLAGDNVIFMGYQPFDVLKDYLGRAKAFIFAAEEDFGMLPVEAQACGTPVIAYAKGGALETVIDGVTGVYFAEQNVQAIVQAVNDFEVVRENFDHKKICDHASAFSTANFRKAFIEFVSSRQRKL